MTQPENNRPSGNDNRQIAQFDSTIHRLLNQVSHDFRTPLTVIKEFATLMRDGLAGPVSLSQRDYLDVINDRADDLARIVDNLLDAEKLGLGTLRAWRRATDPAKVAHGARDSLARKMAIKEIRLHVDVEPNLPNVCADREQLARLLTNIVIGTLGIFEEPQAVRLWVHHVPDSDQVELGATLEGRQLVPRVFDILSHTMDQTQPRDTSHSGGVALHLVLARHLVDLHCGRIQLERPSDAEVTVCVSLPVNRPRSILEAYLRQLGLQREDMPRASLVGVTIDPQVEPAVAGVVDEFLQSSVGANDLVVQTDKQHWLMLLPDAECSNQDDLLDRIDAAWSEMCGGRHGEMLPRIEWTDLGRWNLATDAWSLAGQFDTETVCAGL